MADTSASVCDTLCINSMTYVVWSGQQVIMEDRQRLDFTTTDSASFGTVSYTHGGSTDRPLMAWRKNEAGDICGVMPQFSRRGNDSPWVPGG